MPSVLLAHPGLGFGGSELKVLWAAQALCREHQVSVATLTMPDLEALNRHCGTSLAPDAVEFLPASGPSTTLLGRTDALRGALFARHVRKLASRFDLCISGYNPLDFGRPAIQCIADFSFDDHLRTRFDPPAPGLRGAFHRPSLVRRGYLALARTIAATGVYDRAQDWLIANSAWTAWVLRDRFGWKCKRVIYPPVVAPAGSLRPWSTRENAFVIAGRISPDKRVDWIIDCLARVRAAGCNIRLHVIGRVGTDAYGRDIRRRLRRHADWCIAAGYLGGEQKMALLGRSRFALHGRLGEPFGIAVAEYLRAGCIPFVPEIGGPAEIVGEPTLTFRDTDEAVAKIIHVVGDPARQAALRERLSVRATQFSVERFMGQCRALVADWQSRHA